VRGFRKIPAVPKNNIFLWKRWDSRSLSSSAKGNILLSPSWQREESRIYLGIREYMGSQRDCTEKTWILEVALHFGRGWVGNPGYVFQNKL
jgi:hypothetical protein